MVKTKKVQCDSKLFLIDSFESNGISVQVYIEHTKKSVKQYCKETELPFKEGLWKFYNKF